MLLENSRVRKRREEEGSACGPRASRWAMLCGGSDLGYPHYIHPLNILVSDILSFILNSLVPIYPLYHLLSTLSTIGLICHFI
jgi:hypothetical protein